MLVGIISDTHDNLVKLNEALKFFNEQEVSLVVHCGDFIAPFAVLPLKSLNCKVIATFGNNDGERSEISSKFIEMNNKIQEQPVIEMFDGKSICVVHGDHFDLLNLVLVSGQFDLVTSGHTHRPKIENVGKTLYVNPGECGGWLTGRSTIAIADLEKKSAQIIDF